jgi:excisionase family DNA binding protein
MDGAADHELLSEGAVGVPEAEEFTGLGRTYLYSLMERGELRYAKVGKRRLIPRAELRRLLAACLVNPAE